MDERAFHLDYAQQDRLPQMDQALTTPIDDLHARAESQSARDRPW